MAQRVEVVVEDDMDGSTEAVQTVGFALDGVEWEIDLSADHAEELRQVLAGWIAAARHVGGRRPSRPRPGPTAAPRKSSKGRADPMQLADVRQWARANGHQVNDRGRIPAAVMAAYEQAHA